MSNLNERVLLLATQVGKDIKALNDAVAKIGDLNELNTEEKRSIVLVISSLNTKIGQLESSLVNATGIDDSSESGSTVKTYSSSKILELINLVQGKIGNLANLSDTLSGKTSVIEALNKLSAEITRVENSTDILSDTTNSTDKTYSSTKIETLIDTTKSTIEDTITQKVNEVKNQLLDGAPEALNTLRELAEALNNDSTIGTKLAEGLNNRVRFDSAQSLTSAQKLQACNNIGIGNPDTDFLQAYTTAKQ